MPPNVLCRCAVAQNLKAVVVQLRGSSCAVPSFGCDTLVTPCCDLLSLVSTEPQIVANNRLFVSIDRSNGTPNANLKSAAAAAAAFVGE